jgi:hypothetical protein
MKSTLNPQFPQNIFLQQIPTVTFPRSRSDVRQDKYTSSSVRDASDQPVHKQTQPCTGQTETILFHIQNRSKKERKNLVAGRIDDVSFDRIERLRLQGGENGEELSRSEVVSSLIETALQAHIDMQYGALIKPVIEHSIHNCMRARDNRLVALLVRIAFETGQIRGIVTNNLAIQPGISNENVQTVLTESEREAKANITRLTPQIAEILNELKNWKSDEETEYTA